MRSFNGISREVVKMCESTGGEEKEGEIDGERGRVMGWRNRK